MDNIGESIVLRDDFSSEIVRGFAVVASIGRLRNSPLCQIGRKSKTGPGAHPVTPGPDLR